MGEVCSAPPRARSMREGAITRVPLDARVSADDDEEPTLRAIDVSTGGLAVVGEEAAEPGDLMRLSFKLEGEEVATQGRVVWCREVAESKYRTSGYLIGLQFHQMDRRYRELIQSYVSRQDG